MLNNPFKPGFGLRPAYFAGRVKEENQINNALDCIKGNKDAKGRLELDPDAPIVLIGPRGVGKTVIANRALRTAEKLEIFAIKVTKNELDKNYQGLIKHLLSSNFDFIQDQLKGFGVNLTYIIDKGIDFKGTELILRLVLEAKAKATPMLLVFDEAHTYETESFMTLANALQEVISGSYPLAVIIVGTPELSKKMKNVNANFIQRSYKIFINNLSKAETKDAIYIPFDNENIAFDVDVINLLVKNTDCYPYFTQIVGRLLWDVVKSKNITKVDSKVVDSIADDYRKEKHSTTRNVKQILRDLVIKNSYLKL